MLPEWTIVGFSGHRKLERPGIVAAAIGRALDRLKGDCGQLATISSAASGSDTLFLEEVARRNLPIRLVLPFPRERFKQDFVPADWERVLPVIDGASFVEELTGLASDEEAYLETGILTVERADVMIFVWNGEQAAGPGGTGDIVEYARACGKPLIVINPDTGAIPEDGFESCPVKKEQSEWGDDSLAAVRRHFKQLDDAANREAPKARYLTMGMICLHLIAAAVGIMAFAENPNSGTITSLIELIILLGAAGLAIKQHRSKHEWVNNRVGAELCRSFLATWNLRRRSSFFPTMVIRGFEGLARSLRIAWYLDQTASFSFEEARAGYLKDRVLDQLKFFKGRRQRARFAFRWLNRTANTATALAIVSAALAVKFNGQMWVHMLSVWLPLVNAAVLSIVVSQEHGRRRILYDEMIVRLESIAKRLEVVRTWPSLFRIVMETENALLEELVEWHSFVRFSGEH